MSQAPDSLRRCDLHGGPISLRLSCAQGAAVMAPDCVSSADGGFLRRRRSWFREWTASWRRGATRMPPAAWCSTSSCDGIAPRPALWSMRCAGWSWPEVSLPMSSPGCPHGARTSARGASTMRRSSPESWQAHSGCRPGGCSTGPPAAVRTRRRSGRRNGGPTSGLLSPPALVLHGSRSSTISSRRGRRRPPAAWLCEPEGLGGPRSSSPATQRGLVLWDRMTGGTPPDISSPNAQGRRPGRR